MYKAIVRVTFKDKDGKGGEEGKRYSTKKECDFYENIDEATKDLGARNVLDMVNAKVKDNFAAALREKLTAKVLGEETNGDVEEMELD